MPSIHDLLIEGYHKLQAITDTPRLETEVLLAFILNKPRSFLLTWPEHEPTTAEQNNFQSLLNQRIQGTPIAYLIKLREFWSLPLTISTEVLIPRPDTEILVETALILLPKHEQLQIVDLGTGSGAIAIALAHERSQWQITAVDKSPAALQVAAANAERLKLANIRFIESDWFSAFAGQQFHAIISNPPYIAEDDEHLRIGDLRFEPKSALVAEQHGYADLMTIISHAKFHLHSQGWLILEHGHTQAHTVADMMHHHGYQHIAHAQDLAGINRCTYGQYLNC